jgi:ABC-type transport system involved in cytochrome c biogenesis permease subunit
MRGKWSAIMSILGFLFTLFTFFGVNYLLAGLHSYA